MKIKRNNKKLAINSKTKLVKIKLIRARLYQDLIKKTFPIEELHTYIKKALHVIYKYHTKGKKILFVGFPSKQQAQLLESLEKTRHVVLPNSLWMNGILTNQYSSFQYLTLNSKNISRKHSYLLFKLRYKADLIVILESKFSESIQKESKKTGIPVISLKSNLGVFDIASTSKTQSFSSSVNKDQYYRFLFSLILAVIKKAQTEKLSHDSRKKLSTIAKSNEIFKNNSRKF